MFTAIQASYLLATILFIVGLKQMSSPKTARIGVWWAGGGMLLAVLVTFLWPDMQNYGLMLLAIFLGTVVAYVSAKRVPMADMPQMIALYNGMGGGAAGTIAAIALIQDHADTLLLETLAILGALIGSVAFSGSLIAFAKLQGWLERPIRFAAQQPVNLVLFTVTLFSAVGLLAVGAPLWLITLMFVLALAFGVMVTIPIGGADMPVVISLYNAMTGVAVAMEGFAIGNAAMIVAGTVVGAAGSLLTHLMAKAMNRPLTNVLFGAFGQTGAEQGPEAGGAMKPIDIDDAAIMMAYANKVIVVPGYGMAVAQAQHKLWELCQHLANNGVQVKFAIHPVAGRMPGHMNVLLAEAGVPYDRIFDLDEINPEFPNADVALVIGANDVVNPSARNKPDSPIYGMPILNVDQARNILIIKRGRGTGFSGVENDLFLLDNARMLFGDGQEVAAKLVQSVKQQV